tara:strand:- start:3780 stop:4775 length:996 start_codon:yes stop_codon:yes gene_type:complete
MKNTKLSDLKEKEIIQKLQRFMPTNQIKDDTALINSGNKNLIINTDAMVEGIHFTETTMQPKDIGWKAIISNLSDLASSGANKIIGCTITIIAPKTTSWKWIENVYEGLSEGLKIYGGEILGGDFCRGSENVISITAFGIQGQLLMNRQYAKPGDYLVATGAHGLSRLGLALKTNEFTIKGLKLKKELKKQAIEKYKKPLARLEIIELLTRTMPKNCSSKIACTDSSDGLFNAVENLCDSSNLKAQLDIKNLPRNKDWPKGELWDRWCLYGGEDYELILSLEPNWAKQFVHESEQSIIFGTMEAGKQEVELLNVPYDKKNLIKNSEYKHFK